MCCKKQVLQSIYYATMAIELQELYINYYILIIMYYLNVYISDIKCNNEVVILEVK